MKAKWQGIIEEYREFLPVSGKTPVITLLEGNTPLIKAENLARSLGLGETIYLKLEGANPTGSFKDRGMTMAVSKTLEEGSKAIICASTGNTSAAAAAYGAKAEIQAIVIVPYGGIALGKLAQALIYGAKVIPIKGNFDDCLKIVRQICKKYPVTLVNSINPDRLEGQKTAAFEICDELGQAPHYHFIPVGNAGNITAHWMGYKEYMEKGHTFSLPKMMGFQAAGAAPIVLGRPIEHPKTIASAIRIGNPARWKEGLEAVKKSKGKIDMVTDEEIIEAYQLVAATEGIFCEPASAVSVAGLTKAHKAGVLKEGSIIVCTLTGHGLKDPDSALKVTEQPQAVEPDFKKIVKMLKF